MRVQTTCDMAGVTDDGVVYTHAKGDIIDLPPTVGERAIKHGVAKRLGKGDKVEAPPPEPVAETAGSAAPPK